MATTTDITAPAGPIPIAQGQSVYANAARLDLRDFLRTKLYQIKNARVQYQTRKRRERTQAQAEAGTLKPPSKLIYYPLIVLAILADVAGILLIPEELTGIGAILVSAVSLLVSFFFYAVGLALGARIKGTRNLGAQFIRRISASDRRTAVLRQVFVTTARFVQRSAPGRSLLRTTWTRRLFVGSVRRVSGWLKTLRKTFNYLQIILEAIPFINALPWYTINMLLIYREHHREYTQALEVVKQYPTSDQEEDVAFDSVQNAQVEQVRLLVDPSLA